MKKYTQHIYYSMPVQLFLLHFRKYQVLLLVWFILYSTINGDFFKTFGVKALFFIPEYNGQNSFLGVFLVGVAWGMYMVSWNITTFILHSKRFNFLVTTTHPFLKYCINNSLLPLIFTIFYFVRLYQFGTEEELKGSLNIYADMGGILLGFAFLVLISFAYFFTAGRTIDRSLPQRKDIPSSTFLPKQLREEARNGVLVKYFIGDDMKFTRVSSRNYVSQSYVDDVFRRHHISTLVVLVLGFFFLAIVGFFLDNPVLELPAAASIILFFALLIATMGALSYFLQSWSLPFAIVLLLIINFLLFHEVIDTRNKAYGLNYTNKKERPLYNKASLHALSTPQIIEADKANMTGILNNWKARQNEAKPLMIFINVSGGGLRSAAFTMNSLMQLDSLTNGELMKHCVMMSGASGGMIAATYYRELYRKQKDSLYSSVRFRKEVTDAVTGDLLNPIFTSLVTRDLLFNRQEFTSGKFKYLKDRGYAFERKLAKNTQGLLNTTLAATKKDEVEATVPMLMFNAVINSDGRKLIISTQPVSFLMKPAETNNDPTIGADAVDFTAMFREQNAMDLKLVTALRMNASFPYVLPNVWLPSDPVIDVMDAGLRDNYGPETTMRFIDQFRDWIAANTGGVLIIQLRDNMNDNWQQLTETKNIGDVMLSPGTMLQKNWGKIQQYFMTDQYYYLKSNSPFPLQRIEVMYIASNKEKQAAMSLHLSANDERDVVNSFYHPQNRAAIDSIRKALGR